MAVADRMYARALFAAAQDKGNLAEVREELSDFVTAVREVPELRQLLVNPEVDSRVKADALRELLAGADEVVRNFLLLLAEKGRVAQLEEIAREFEGLVAAEEGRLEVGLTTAVELSDEEADRLVGQIEQASGRTVVATRSVDPALIGGLILQAGSRRVDASVRGRLDRLRHQLVSRR
jgi:F-type H+-transporting ATPase subunit delta